jgi:hypothetical protein
MSNVLICYRNRADECTLSGGSWSAGLPLDNLKNRDIRLMARSTDALAANTQFVAALAAQRPIRTVALIRSNCSLAATWRVRIYTDSGLTNLVHDSGTVDVFPPWMYAFGYMDWEGPEFWDGRPAAEDIDDFSSDVIYPLPTAAVGQYVKVEITDTANAAGYLEVGRLFLSDGWQPTWNMAEGASIAHDDLSAVTQSPAGKEFFTEREVRRVVRLQMPHLTEYEGARVFDLQRIAKTINEVLVVWDPDDLADVKRRGFMGRMRQLSPIEYPFYETNSTAYEIQEIL